MDPRALEIKERLRLVRLDGAEMDFIAEIYGALGAGDIRDPEYHFTGSRVAGVWCHAWSFVYAPDGNLWDGVYAEYHFAEKELRVGEDAPVLTEDAGEAAARILARRGARNASHAVRSWRQNP